MHDHSQVREQSLYGIAYPQRVMSLDRVALGDYQKFPRNYSKSSNFLKVAFNHEQSFLTFAKISKQLLATPTIKFHR